MEVKAGDKLWMVPTYGKNKTGRYVEVEKVGRKWATLKRQEGRIHKTELWVDGGQYSPPAQCWRSEEDYHDYVSADRALVRLRNNIPYRPPDGVSKDDIVYAASLLGIDIDE